MFILEQLHFSYTSTVFFSSLNSKLLETIGLLVVFPYGGPEDSSLPQIIAQFPDFI